MSSPVRARAAIDAALIQIEARLAGNPPAEETQALRAAYAALWVQLAKIDDAMLGQAADRVIAASQRLEQIVRSAGTIAPAAYRAALASATVAIETGQPPAAGTASPPPGAGVVQPPGAGTAATSASGDGWQQLIAAYRTTQGVSAALKTVSLAQWIVESGRGSSPLARQHLNFGGIKFRDRMVGHAVPVDYTGSDGETTVYCKFGSVVAFIAGYWHFIASGPYDGWQAFSDDGPGYLRHIAAKYAGDPAYVTKVLGVYEEAAGLLGTATVAPGGTGTIPSSGAARVAVVVGHNSGSKGHAGHSPIDLAEYDWNSQVAEAMRNEAGHYGLTVGIFFRPPGVGYSTEIRRAYDQVAAYDPICALELHYNGFGDPSANGIEMLCRLNNSPARGLALKLVGEVHGLLGLHIRRGDGVFLVSPGENGAGSCYALDAVPTVLCEPFFVSNATDRLKMAEVGQGALARAYLRAMRDWSSAS